MPANETMPGTEGKFVSEFSACWRAMPEKGIFFALLAAWLGLFHFLGNSALGYFKTPSLFVWMESVMRSTVDDEHGLIVPFVVAYLFWGKRAELLAVKKQFCWPALGLVGAGLVLHIGGFAVHQTRLSIAGFFLGLYGLTGLVWGGGWLRASFFPFFLFVFCIPLQTVADVLTTPLRLMAAALASGVARVAGVDVVRTGTLVSDASGTFAYDVAPACSGIRSLTTLSAMTMIYGFTQFAGAWRRLAMVLSAIPLAVAGNVARLVAVIFVAEVFGQDAGAWVEQKLGFVTFIVAIAGMFGLGRWLREGAGEGQGG